MITAAEFNHRISTLNAGSEPTVIEQEVTRVLNTLNTMLSDAEDKKTFIECLCIASSMTADHLDQKVIEILLGKGFNVRISSFYGGNTFVFS